MHLCEASLSRIPSFASSQVFEDANGDVTSVALDSLVKTHGLKPVDALKIDVEGSEVSWGAGGFDGPQGLGDL